MTWKLRDYDNHSERTFDSRAEAEDAKADMESLGADVELTHAGHVLDEPTSEPDDDDVSADGGAVEPEPDPEPVVDDIPESPDVAEDPVSWMPEHFVDIIESTPTINRKGYAVLAEHYGIAVTAEAVTYPSESGFEYAEFEATAVTDDGREYSGFGSAHVERDDDETLLGELAETRAVKRSLALATGVGMTAVSELQGTLEGER